MLRVLLLNIKQMCTLSLAQDSKTINILLYIYILEHGRTLNNEGMKGLKVVFNATHFLSPTVMMQHIIYSILITESY